jgi:polar amino acid transport system permease protein
MPGLDFSVVFKNYEYLVQGAMWTIVLCSFSSILSLVGGVLLAVMSLARNALLRSATAFFIWLFQGTPLLLQLFLIYFGLPSVGIYLTPMVSGIIGLSIHYAAYNSDVIRAGITAVDRGQHEASRSLGLSRPQTMRKVIVPQALRNVTPALGNGMISLLKESALVSIITVPELTLAAQRAITETFRPFEFYAAAAVLYYLINSILELIVRRIETKVALAR